MHHEQRRVFSFSAVIAASAILLLPAFASAELFSLSRSSGELWIVDPDFSDTEVMQQVTVDGGGQVCTGNGLSTQPTTGTMFAVVWLNGCGDATRTLVTIDPATAVATIVGSLGATTEKVASIAFGADANTLYASTGNNGSSPRSLFTVDPTDGTMTKVCGLSGEDGQVLNFADGLIYHATTDSNFNTVLESIDPASFPADPNDPCPAQDLAIDGLNEPTAMVTTATGGGTVEMLIANFQALYHVTIPGVSAPSDTVFLGYMLQSSKGLALSDADITVGNLSITKFASKFRNKGQRYIEYNIIAHNDGPDSIGSVVVTDPIPTGTALVGAGGCTLDGDILTCNIGTLDAGEDSQFNFTVEVLCKKCSSVFNAAFIGTTAAAYEYPFDNSSATSTSVKGKF